MCIFWARNSTPCQDTAQSLRYVLALKTRRSSRLCIPPLPHKPAPISNVDIAPTIHKRKSYILIGHSHSNQKRKSESTPSPHTFIPRSFHPQLALQTRLPARI